MNAFFGDPDSNMDGLPDRKWEAENLVRIAPPYPMIIAWNGQPLSRITIHKKCAESLLRALGVIGNKFNAAERDKIHLNRYDGGYNFRTMRGSNNLSIHAWGAAIDLAPELNPLGRPAGVRPLMMPEAAVLAFRNEGWIWGGPWKRPDGQHFQAARIV